MRSSCNDESTREANDRTMCLAGLPVGSDGGQARECASRSRFRRRGTQRFRRQRGCDRAGVRPGSDSIGRPYGHQRPASNSAESPRPTRIWGSCCCWRRWPRCHGRLRLTDGVPSVLQALDDQDAADVYEAIRLAQPGGLAPRDHAVTGHDVAMAAPTNLLAAMAEAAAWDLVARQYANGYEEVLRSVLPWLLQTAPERPLPERIVHVHHSRDERVSGQSDCPQMWAGRGRGGGGPRRGRATVGRFRQRGLWACRCRISTSGCGAMAIDEIPVRPPI